MSAQTLCFLLPEPLRGLQQAGIAPVHVHPTHTPISPRYAYMQRRSPGDNTEPALCRADGLGFMPGGLHQEGHVTYLHQCSWQEVAGAWGVNVLQAQLLPLPLLV